MTRSVFVLAVALVIVLGLSTGTTQATSQGNGAIAHWKTMDTCAKQAQAAFPDFTPDADAKRDAKLKECLSSQNLPPREPLSPPPR